MKQVELLKRIKELEQRVRDLEARPVYVPIPYTPVLPYTPLGPYRAPWENPWYVGTPSTCVSGGSLTDINTTTVWA